MSDKLPSPRVEHVLTNGYITGEGQRIPIDNNVWLIGNDSEVLVIDAAHEANKIADAVGNRNVLGILLTHGHQDHINAAQKTAKLLDSQLYLHPNDLFLWHQMFTEEPDFKLEHKQEFQVAGLDIVTLHTPGHTPGSVSFFVKDAGVVFSGDTLFHGGPGATRWEYSDFKQIINSIKTQLFVLHPETVVLPGHGQKTSIQAETKQLEAYIARGW